MPKGPELWIVIGIIVLLFGGSQLPKLARNLGSAQKEFKKGFSDASKDEAEKPSSEGDK
jgi:sec-independent protein translocase protein TatA